jgi:hypothetical protein
MEIYEDDAIGLAAGAIEIITPADVKAWSLIETDLDDDIILSIIVSAREMIEHFISKDLISKERVFFADELDYDGEKYTATLDRYAKPNTIVATSNGVALVNGTDYELIGLSGSYIKFYNYASNVTINYESKPIASSSEIQLAKSAVKVLIEQIYDNRGNLEGDEDIVIRDMNVKKILAPLRTIYL